MNRPFLTDLDSRAAVKGSRDPLGIQSIWGRFGRHVVGNLTTVSTSARDFTVTLLGFHFAERLAETVGPGSELGTFLKWEQLAAYARASVNGETVFRGTERVARNLAEGSVTLGTRSQSQILSNQKIYGLWGLYTVPSRSSGLLDGLPARLTPAARSLVEELYLPRLSSARPGRGHDVEDLLAREGVELDLKGRHRRIIEAIAGFTRPVFTAREREFYREHLLHGGPNDSTGGLQRQLADLLASRLEGPDLEWSCPLVLGLAKEASAGGPAGQALVHRLQRIAVAERLLAPASMLYVHLLGSDGTGIGELSGRVRECWGPRMTTIRPDDLEPLEAELGGDDSDAGPRWLGIGRAMASGDYDQAIRLLLAQNRAVMEQRGGLSAWIEEQNGRLKVRMPEERGELVPRDELESLWRFPYFLPSLASMSQQLDRRRHD